MLYRLQCAHSGFELNAYSNVQTVCEIVAGGFENDDLLIKFLN